MNADKFLLKSRTVWGALVMLIPVVQSLTGINLTPGSAESIVSAGDAVIAAIGAVLVIYGRYKAGGLTINPSA